MSHIDEVTRFTNTRAGMGKADMAPMIEGYRDGEMIVVAQCIQIDRDDALMALPFLVGGMALDAVVMCMDSHYTNQANNPTTGKPWGPGEMQQACDHDHLCDTGAITDCLAISEHHRDGTHRQVMTPYHVTSDETVHWQDEIRYDEDTTVAGRIVDALNHAFSLPPMSDQILREGLMHDPDGIESLEEARHHADCAVAKLLMKEKRHQLMLPADSELRREVIQRSFSSDGWMMGDLDGVEASLLG